MITRIFSRAVIDGENAEVTAYTKNGEHFVCVQICSDDWSPTDYYLEKSSSNELVIETFMKDNYDVTISMTPF